MEFLKSLGIKEFNSGAYLGDGNWSTTTNAGVKDAINPSTGEVIAKVHTASADDYETLINRSAEIFMENNCKKK